MKRALLVLVAFLSAVDLSAATHRVLVPLVAHAVPGAFGSVWQTESEMFNLGVTSLTAVYERSCPGVCTGSRSVGGEQGIELNDAMSFANGSGALLYIVSDDAPRVGFALRVRDLSRQAESWGTEIPVVREEDAFSDTFDLLGVPLLDRFRHMLRVYDLTGQPGTVHVEYFSTKTGERVGTFDLALLGRNDVTFTLENHVVPEFPSYAQLYEPITQTALVAGDTLRVRITPSGSTQRLWAFVTITNNETQQLTTITPQ